VEEYNRSKRKEMVDKKIQQLAPDMNQIILERV
jgi:hypothetical protein